MACLLLLWHASRITCSGAASQRVVALMLHTLAGCTMAQQRAASCWQHFSASSQLPTPSSNHGKLPAVPGSSMSRQHLCLNRGPAVHQEGQYNAKGPPRHTLKQHAREATLKIIVTDGSCSRCNAARSFRWPAQRWRSGCSHALDAAQHLQRRPRASSWQLAVEDACLTMGGPRLQLMAAAGGAMPQQLLWRRCSCIGTCSLSSSHGHAAASHG